MRKLGDNQTHALFAQHQLINCHDTETQKRLLNYSDQSCMSGNLDLGIWTCWSFTEGQTEQPLGTNIYCVFTSVLIRRPCSCLFWEITNDVGGWHDKCWCRILPVISDTTITTLIRIQILLLPALMTRPTITHNHSQPSSLKPGMTAWRWNYRRKKINLRE